jgi:hypothetical protein
MLALSPLGCTGSSSFKARGRITKNGAPFRLGENEGLRISFNPLQVEHMRYNSYAAVYDNDGGTFRVVGKDGKGLPPGKYQVGLQLMKKKEDLFKGKLLGAKSPFVCDVTNESTEIVIDLDQAKDVLVSAR